MEKTAQKTTELTVDLTGNERDKISKTEYEALCEFKKHDVAQGFSDKTLICFLFARKLDVDRAVTLLQNHLKWMKEHGYTKTLHIEQLNQELVKTMYSFSIPGNRDKEGHKLQYLFPARVNMKKYTVKEHLDLLVWWFQTSLVRETVDSWRTGIVFIEEIKGMSLRNMDMNVGKEIMKASQDHFPMRIRKILVVNPTYMIKILLGFARLFLKKKIMERVALIEQRDLMNIVDPDQLISHYGGTLKFEFGDLCALDTVSIQ